MDFLVSFSLVHFLYILLDDSILEYLPFISIISFTMFVFVFASQTSMSLFWHSSKCVLVNGKFRFFTCATAVVAAAKIPKKKLNIFPVNGNTQRPCTFSQENLFLFVFLLSWRFTIPNRMRVLCSNCSLVCFRFLVRCVLLLLSSYRFFFHSKQCFFRIHKNM